MNKLTAAFAIVLLSSGASYADDKGQASVTTPVVSTSAFDGSAPFVPKGYRLAWTDDRLNPLRGVGTSQGDAAMKMVWTDDVPARLVSE